MTTAIASTSQNRLSIVVPSKTSKKRSVGAKDKSNFGVFSRVFFLLLRTEKIRLAQLLDKL